MDSGKAIASGVTVAAPGAPSSYHVAPRTDNSESGTLPMTSPAMSGSSERKKRGRPRKYKPDELGGTVYSGMPMLSSSPTAVGKSYLVEPKPSVARPTSLEKKNKNKMGAERLDDWIECVTGSSFLPHVITVNTGEDISTKIMEFSLQGPRAVCIISGSGMVSNVTIRQPTSSGGTLTYEGLFEILSFRGSFTPTEMTDSRFGRAGMMTITLSSADGRVVGGLIGGLTVAATPVNVVVASFLLGSQDESKGKKQKTGVSVDASGSKGAHAPDVEKPGGSTSEIPTTWAQMHPGGMSRKSSADINISLQG